jgi:myo-inositol 2-dehydrogenase / D-chiro-inositol 1-dehydrogenase
MVSIGVVGCGKIAERHLHAYNRMTGVKVSVTDLDPDVAAATAAAFHVPHVGALDGMLGHSYDAIDVCVPTPFHHEVVMAALRAGKHVFCEKPLCSTVPQALEIRAAADQANRTVAVGYLYRYHPAFKFIKQTLDDGIIGTPYFATLRLGGRGSAATWKHDSSTGGGASLEMLVHMLDLAMWMLGDFSDTRVHTAETLLRSRQINGRLEPATAEDVVIVSLVRDGARAICEADLVTPSYMNHVEIQGDEGSIFTSILHYLPTIVYCKEARDIFNKGNNFFNFSQTNLFDLELGAFVENLRTGIALRDSVDDAIRLLQVLAEVSRWRENNG